MTDIVERLEWAWHQVSVQEKNAALSAAKDEIERLRHPKIIVGSRKLWEAMGEIVSEAEIERLREEIGELITANEAKADALEACQAERDVAAANVEFYKQYYERLDEWKARAEKAEAEIKRLLATKYDLNNRKANAEIERLREALEGIVRWADAYPLDIFPEPDFKKAHELLKAGGITLDAVSASCMRHVVEGVGKIAKEALNQQQET